MRLFSQAFTQGGQTELHKFHMWRQVVWSTLKFSFIGTVLIFIGMVCYEFSFRQIWLVSAYHVAAYMVRDIGLLPDFRLLIPINDGTNQYIYCSTLAYLPQARDFVQDFWWRFMDKVYLSLYIWMGLVVTIASIWIWAGKRTQRTRITKGSKMVPFRYLKGMVRQEIRKKEGRVPYYANAILCWLPAVVQKTLTIPVQKSLKFAGVPLPYAKETHHILLTGTTGSGKSNALHHLLQQLRERGDRAIIVDSSGSLFSRFYEAKQGDKILNPLDERGERWDIWSECQEPYEYKEFAQSIIQHKSADPIWTESAENLFAATARKLGEQETLSMRQLVEKAITAPLDQVKDFYDKTEVASFMHPKTEKTAVGIRLTLGSKLLPFSYLKSHGQRFSIKEWVQDEKSQNKEWLFMTCMVNQRSMMKSLLAAWLSAAYKFLMEKGESQSRRLWFIIDELPSLGTMPNLVEALAEVRKYGGCFVLGAQNFSQLDKIYGPDLTLSLAGLCETKLVFRAPESKTARRLSELFGEQEIVETVESISFGAHQVRDGVSISKNARFQPVVSMTDIMKLEDLQAYIQLPGSLPVSKIKYSYLKMDKKNTDYVQRNLTEAEEEISNNVHNFVDKTYSFPDQENTEEEKDQDGPALERKLDLDREYTDGHSL